MSFARNLDFPKHAVRYNSILKLFYERLRRIPVIPSNVARECAGFIRQAQDGLFD